MNIIDCPGAWYGNTPKPEYANCGHVIVDPEKIVDAIQWLKRRFWVKSTKLTTDKGICIELQIKQNLATFAD